MTKMKRWVKAQSTAEYAIVIALVLGALVGMQTYVKRAINARVADAADTRFPVDKEFDRTQFEPYYATADAKTDTQIRTPGTVKVTGSAGTVSAVTGKFTTITDRKGGSGETGAKN